MDESQISVEELAQFRMHLLDVLATGKVDRALVIETIRVLERAGLTLADDRKYLDKMVGLP